MVRAADPRRLGAHLVDGGVDFAIWAPAAESVSVCLFGTSGSPKHETRFALAHRDGPIWHGHLAGIGAGERYGYRIHGPWQPEQGLRFNPMKLLIDPYAHLLAGEVASAPEIFGHHAVDAQGNGSMFEIDSRDSSPFVPLSVVTNHQPRPITRPNIPWRKTVIYEAHLRGLTFANESIPSNERGSYKALGHPSTIEYLLRLGVNAIELLPIQEFCSEVGLRSRGRTNHWGYNPIIFSAPHRGYAASEDPIIELQEAVAALHAAGIEVILDLVYNHTAEEGLAGPTLNLRGIDNKGFYRHLSDDRYEDLTGCGNTLDTRRPFVTRLIIDSLHWWSEVIGVDGFRFDLTTAISRSDMGIDTYGPLISAISADPILRQRKLIAEPWDIAGYALGDFPHPWREWNDAYRDAVRQFWLADSARGHSQGVSDLASRIAGSNDIFYYRGPTSSINYITAHDGFTLRDLVTFEAKHNDANQECNRDGSDNNRSWNVGIEGECDDREINSIRSRLQKSLLATLAFSAGIPMFTMGDESGRSQQGSNNAYSLDLTQPWDATANFSGGWALNWSPDEQASELIESLAALLKLRAQYLEIDEFFTGAIDRGTNRKDLAWFNQDGLEMTLHTWQDPSVRHLIYRIESSHRQALFVILNANANPTEFTLPNQVWGDSYRLVFDAASPTSELVPIIKEPSDSTLVPAYTAQIWLANRIKT